MNSFILISGVSEFPNIKQLNRPCPPYTDQQTLSDKIQNYLLSSNKILVTIAL